jgi:WD40 repeat protein
MKSLVCCKRLAFNFFFLALAFPLLARGDDSPHGARPVPLPSGRGARNDLNGDPLPDGAVCRFGTTRLRHGSGLRALNFALGGKLLVSFGSDEKVRVWDVDSGREPWCLPQSEHQEVSSSAVSPDGRLIAAGFFFGDVVRVWDAATGKEVHTLGWATFDPEMPAPSFHSLAFSADNQLLAVESWNSLVIRYLVDGRLHSKLTPSQSKRNQGILAIAFSPDGKSIAAGVGDQVVTLWNLADGKELRHLRGHEEPVFALRFAPDGKTLAVGSGDGTLRVWDPATGKLLITRNGPKGNVGAGGWSFAFSPDGKKLAAGGSNNAVHLWDTTSYRKLRKIGHHPDCVRHLDLSADGKVLATDSGTEAIRLWKVATGEEIMPVPGPDCAVTDLGLTHDGRDLVTGSLDGTIRVWESATGRQIRVLRGPSRRFNSVALSPDSNLIAAAWDEKIIRLWDGDTGKELKQLRGHDQEVTCLTFAPKKMILASGSRDRTIRLWEPTAGRELICLQGHSRPVTQLAFAPDGKLLASIQRSEDENGDHSIRLWDLKTGKNTQRLIGHTSTVNALVFLRDGKSLASLGWDALRIWDITTRREIRRMELRDSYVLALSPDGSMLATENEDHAAHIWDVATLTERVKLSGHQSTVDAVAFSPDGKLLYTGSEDTTALAWDLAGMLKGGGAAEPTAVKNSAPMGQSGRGASRCR